MRISRTDTESAGRGAKENPMKGQSAKSENRPLPGSLPSQAKFKLLNQVDCIAKGDTNLDRTTLGLGEIVHLNGMPDSTIWSLNGDGTISGTNGSAVDYIAPLHSTKATVYAKVASAQPLSVSFDVVKPDSVVVDGFWLDVPWHLGTESTSGTQMGAETYYLVTITPKNVSFAHVNFRETLQPLTIIWPNGSTNVVRIRATTNSISFPCGFSSQDDITVGLKPISLLFNGTNYLDFSYSSSWTDQYLDDAANWIDFASLSRTAKFRASDKKCQNVYLGTPGDWQGPF